MSEVHSHRPYRNGFRPTNKKPQPVTLCHAKVGERRTGVVKFFNGMYGFIVPKGGGEDVYFQNSAVEAARITKLKKDQPLSFDTFRQLDGRNAGKLFANSLKRIPT